MRKRPVQPPSAVDGTRPEPLARPVTVAVDALDDDGAGLATHDGLRLHIAGALPGERVTAAIVHRSPHRADAWATLLAVTEPAVARQPPVCAAFGRCGGCVLGHYDATAQATWKEAHLRALVAAALPSSSSRVRPIVASPHPRGYRNQSKLVIGRQPNGRVVLGGYAPRSHDIVDLAGCTLIEPALVAATEVVRAALDASPIPAYDERTREGELRYALVRANAAGEVLLTLVTRSEEVNHLDDLVAALRHGSSPALRLVGIVQSINPSPGNALYGERHVVRWGRDSFLESIAGLELEVSFRAFFQINRGVAERMWLRAKELVAARPPARVVDVYCGVGGFGLALGGDADLVGIEVVEPAVVAARANATRASRCARYVAGDAAALLADVEGADLVLLNPPRRGCDEAVLHAVARLAPAQLFYMSCEPKTLVRDLGRLAPLGYEVATLEPFDMMPHTPHYEVLTTLRRADARDELG